MISQPCVTNNRIEHRASSIQRRSPYVVPTAERKRISGLLSIGSWSARSARYFYYFLKLLTDYRSVKTIEGGACLAVTQ